MKKLQLIVCFLALLLFGSCNSCPGDGLADEDDGEKRFYFTLRYQPTPNNWQPAIGVFGIYPKDSVKLYDENLKLVDDFWIATGGGGESSIPIVNQMTPHGQDIVKTYFLYLTYQDTDTLRVEFKLNKDNCKNIMSYGRFFYNNKLISQNENMPFNLGGTVVK